MRARDNQAFFNQFRDEFLEPVYGPDLANSYYVHGLVIRALANNEKYDISKYNTDEDLYDALNNDLIKMMILVDYFYKNELNANKKLKLEKKEIKKAFLWFETASNEEINVKLIATNRSKRLRHIPENESDDDYLNHDRLEKRLFDLARKSIVNGRFNEEIAITLIPKSSPPASIYDRVYNLDLQEKFLRQSITGHEWLNDNDLLKLLRLYGLNERVAIIALNKVQVSQLFRTSLGHTLSEGKYTLPVLVNKGESHWTRALVTVDHINKKVKVKYGDSFLGGSNIENTFKNALNDTCPGYKLEIDVVIESQLQGDGWSCGYRALKNLLSDSDFPYSALDANNVDLQRLKRLEVGTYSPSKWSNRLRDEVYATLLRSMRVTQPQLDKVKNPHSHEAVEPAENSGKLKFKEDYIEGYCRNTLGMNYDDEWSVFYRAVMRELQSYNSSYFKSADRAALIISLIKDVEEINKNRDKKYPSKTVHQVLEKINAASLVAIGDDIQADHVIEKKVIGQIGLFAYRNVTGSRFQSAMDRIRDDAHKFLIYHNDTVEAADNEKQYLDRLFEKLKDNANMTRVIRHTVVAQIAALDGRDGLSAYREKMLKVGFHNRSQRSFYHFLTDVCDRIEKHDKVFGKVVFSGKKP